MVAKAKATVAKAVVRAMREEAAQVVMQCKTSTEFEDKISEAVCDAFYKGFEKCKKKMAHAFNISNLDDITANEPEGAGGRIDPPVRADPIKAAKLEANAAPPQASLSIKTTTRPAQPGSVREIIVQVTVEMGVMIDATMKAFKFGGVPTPNSEP